VKVFFASFMTIFPLCLGAQETRKLHPSEMQDGFSLTLPSNPETGKIYLSGTGTDDAVNWGFYCTAGRDSGKWSEVPVPSNWEFHGFGDFTYGHDKERVNESGFYKYSFKVPDHWKQKKVRIVFDGSMTDTEVKINGRLAGAKHQGAFYRFDYDVGKLLKYGQENVLEVKVDKASSDSLVEDAERIADFWVFGGIFRPVWLEAVPPEHIRRTAIDAQMDGRFVMDVFFGSILKQGELLAQVMTMDGKPYGEPVRASFEKADSIRLTAEFDHPDLWSSEFPNRYKVEVSLLKNGQPVHKTTQKFGFRTAELRPGDGFYVNNVKIRFKGVNRHSHWPTSGRATNKTLSINDILLIKEMNMNAVRMSHYSPDEHFLDACDSLGLYVIDELTAWQYPPYSTPVGTEKVRQLVSRDLNHPGIVMWANGNEGGFNFELLPVFQRYDIQKRPVIHPWLEEDHVNTFHYMAYGVGTHFYFEGNKVFFPTEFLHGLYDGGHGAGLDDYWNLMLATPLSAGGFLWDFADQAVVRPDKNNFLDTDGDHGADGIVGPYREKEGSFFAIKEIWSPVFLEGTHFIPPGFDGTVRVQNRYHFTNLNQCAFTAKWLTFNFLTGKTDELVASVHVPSVEPGFSGDIRVETPSDFQRYDALAITATDPHGKEIYTWTRTVTPAARHAERITGNILAGNRVEADEQNNTVTLKSGNTFIVLDKDSGRITSIQTGNKIFPLANGPRFTTGNLKLSEVRAVSEAGIPVYEFIYRPEGGNTGRSSRNIIRISLLPSEWTEINYSFDVGGRHDHIGVTFDIPENDVRSVKWLGNGPYRVWKNRLKGVTFGVWEKEYNNTVTGESWVYPEFKGFHSNLYAADLRTAYGTLRIVAASEDLFLHLLTPSPPVQSKNTNTLAPFPDGNLSILNGISPVGTKFMKATEHGPQSQPNNFVSTGHTMPLIGKFLLKIEPE
jgi:hypothetical protein